jgi:hypothetical protein
MLDGVKLDVKLKLGAEKQRSGGLGIEGNLQKESMSPAHGAPQFCKRAILAVLLGGLFRLLLGKGLNLWYKAES